MRFRDRTEAGRLLGQVLAHLQGEDTVVLGLPRGGVPVAAEVARALGAPLDVIVVRKLGVPQQPELGMGAIGEGGVRVVDPEIVRLTGATERDLASVEDRERAELERRARRFRGDRSRTDVADRSVVIVDDGIATGSTAKAACQVARAQGAARVVLAVPVAPPGWESRIGADADETVAVDTPEPFQAIGRFYDDFSQTSDEEVVRLLQDRAPSGGGTEAVDEEVTLEAAGARLGGHLTVPDGAPGVVAFAHGSGSSRHSERNRYVAGVLQGAGLGTLLFDLLTRDEERDRANVFDIPLLGRRLLGAVGWLRDARGWSGSVGCFGASTGAGAALWAAAEPGARIAAVVSRGGRPDLAGERLLEVEAPTLLIVGGDDVGVLDLNREAHDALRCERRLEVVPGASHLFEEPGTLETAAELARDWFSRHLAPVRSG